MSYFLNNKIKNRDSNVELLRLLCMFGIVVMHSIGLAVFRDVWNPTASLTPELIVGTCICSFTILSVNIFGIISGYYGINFSWSGLFKLYFCCAFYAAIGGVVGFLTKDRTNINDVLLETFLPFSKSGGGWWYIYCYLGLYLLSPILNKAIQSMTKKEYQLALLMLCIVNIYLGRYCLVNSYNGSGYSLAQLIFLYFIGRYIHLYIPIATIRKHCKVIFFLLIGCLGIWSGLTLLQHSTQIPFWDPTAYNHIVTMLGAVCLFMLVLTWNFKNTVINYLAMGSLAIYLVHMNTHIWAQIPPLISNFAQYGVLGYAYILLFALIVVCVLATFDSIRRFFSAVILRCIQFMTSKK